MITQNLDLESGAANGATTQIASIRLQIDMRDEIRLRITCSDKEVAVRRSSVKNLYHNEKRYFKATFPLMLGYAITAHRSQGATLRGKVIVDVK